MDRIPFATTWGKIDVRTLNLKPAPPRDTAAAVLVGCIGFRFQSKLVRASQSVSHCGLHNDWLEDARLQKMQQIKMETMTNIHPTRQAVNTLFVQTWRGSHHSRCAPASVAHTRSERLSRSRPC